MSRIRSGRLGLFRSRFAPAIAFCYFFLFCPESAHAIIRGARVDPKSAISNEIQRIGGTIQEKKGGKWIDVAHRTRTGLLVDSRTILTARHCIELSDENWRIRLSVYFQNPNGSETKATVVSPTPPLIWRHSPLIGQHPQMQKK
ncbi:trypsin-like serine protease [Xanthobacter dioxanivorans]|uniref:Trypsin-like serine protease n=1 Tax=Xanthobacter dioxanivorans TaxID=2528964 RepID=A0A974PS95_9HYPH|nr:trypsin-like serine protease [Xanthobacter dioxanivorans]